MRSAESFTSPGSSHPNCERKRFAAGSLDLDFPEVKVWLDAQGKPLRLEKIENDISHQLIEELMLLANELVARELMRRRQPSIYRVHEKPDPDRMLEFRETALILGVLCGDLSHRPELQRLLASVRGKPQEYAIKLGLLKSLKRARYAPEPLGHYGLHKSNYTHFTSPIRRYSDLVVHRALGHLLGLSKRAADSSVLGSMADHISTTERIAADAEKDSVKLKKLEFFQNQLSSRDGGDVFSARILGSAQLRAAHRVAGLSLEWARACLRARWRFFSPRCGPFAAGGSPLSTRV